MARFLLLMPECAQRALQVGGIGQEINIISRLHAVAVFRHDLVIAPHDANDGDVEVREQRGEVAQRGVEHRAGRPAMHADEGHEAIGQCHRLERARHLQAAMDRLRHFDFRRDHGVDPEVIGSGKMLDHLDSR